MSTESHTPPIILASASPRRRQFLADLGLCFEVKVADIDETPRAGESPDALACRLAREKARAVAEALGSDPHQRLIIAADTVVAMGRLIFGKPIDPSDASRMLIALRARTHQVHSAVCVLDLHSHRQLTRINTTTVEMRAYEESEINRYVAGGDPLDKAGAYAIQHREFAPVQRLEGCFAAVMGLPLADLRDILVAFGVAHTRPIVEACKIHNPHDCCQEHT